MIWVIQDWAGNFIHFDGSVKSPSYAVPMEFGTFEDAVQYLDVKYSEEDRQEFYVVERVKGE